MPPFYGANFRSSQGQKGGVRTSEVMVKRMLEMPILMKMTLRLPLQVHTALTEEAKETGNSVNQIIVDRLNVSLGGVYVGEKEANEENFASRLRDLEARVVALEKAK
jgi:hypothetical protein